MAFLNPLYLWAFLGLAVPLAIHFWSKKEGRTIQVGSIKFFKESDPKHASSIKLNELWLLVLRMLALSLLVFILAGPVLKSEGSPSPLTYLVEPSLLLHEEMSRIMDTIDSRIEVKLLANGFPDYSVGDEINQNTIPDYWKLAHKMQELNSDSIVVFTAAYIRGVERRRPRMGKHINWIQITPDESINKPIAAIQKGEEIEIISVSGDHTRIQINKENTLFANNNISINVTGDSIIIDHNQSERSLPFRIADTLKVSLFSDEDLEEQMRYIRSSLRAISVYLNTPLSITDLSEGNLGDDQDDLLVWLSNSAGKELNSTVLMWKPDSLANSLIEPGSKKNVFYLTRWLNSENIVEENLPEELIQLLNINAEIEEEIRKYDRRVMPLEEILPVTGIMGGNIEINKVRDISRYFWFLLVIILISERGLSAYRKQ